MFNNDLRHPAVLAQDLATLDLVSAGRLVVGIGAGWNEPEYAAIGIAFDPPGVRIERMLEAVTVLRGLFADGAFSFAGRHYTITDLDGQPKPAQRPTAVPDRRHARARPAGRRPRGRHRRTRPPPGP